MRTVHIFLLTILFGSSLYSADAQNITTPDTNSTSTFDALFSKEDGAFDVSDYLATKYGFMPVPVIITEPAVGYGAGLTMLFLHDSFGESMAKRKSPPSMSGIMAMATENGTWAGGAFHLGYWNEDSIRSTTAAAYLNVNADFHLSILEQNVPIDMNINGYFAYQELMFRIAGSDFFLGGNYMYSDTTSKSNNQLPPILPTTDPKSPEAEFKMGGLAGIVQYDTRDTTFTPSEGLFAKATLRRFDENLGGSENFWRYGAKAFYFIPIGNPIVLGLRMEGEGVHTSEGDNVPFYANPAINMRGIPATRYQGEKMLLGELQLRWEFINRWNLVAFGGGGKVFGEQIRIFDILPPKSISLQDADFHPAGGLGFRYELARKFGMWGGMDFATSEENNFAFYFTVGSAWGAF